MAATDTRTGEGARKREAAPEPAAEPAGPLRDPDGCLLACPDCACRLLLERHRAEIFWAGRPGLR